MNWNDNVNTQEGHKVKLADFIKAVSGASEMESNFKLASFKGAVGSNSFSVDLVSDVSSDIAFLAYVICNIKNESGTVVAKGCSISYKVESSDYTLIGSTLVDELYVEKSVTKLKVYGHCDEDAITDAVEVEGAVFIIYQN